MADPKYLREARACLDSVAAGECARLDESVRRGMVGELRARGIEVYKERTDAYVAQRYATANRTDTWSDEARAAALEARRASRKAETEGSAESHQQAAAAHTAVAQRLRGAGDSAATWKAVGHESAAVEHTKIANAIAAENIGGPSSDTRSVLGEKSGTASNGRISGVVVRTPNPLKASSPADKTIPAKAGTDHPPTIEHAGAEWHRTGKTGTDIKTGQPSAEYSKAGTSGNTRLWHGPAGVSEVEGNQNEKLNRASTRASAKALAASRDARIAGTPEAHEKAAVAHAKAANANERAGTEGDGHREEMTRHKLTASNMRATAASAEAQKSNTVAAHGEASKAHNAAAKVAAKAGKPEMAASHTTQANEHLAAMRNVLNANTQTAVREHAASPIGKAEATARDLSSTANLKTRGMAGAGSAGHHEMAATMHSEAKAAWQKVEKLARAGGNEFKATAAHSYVEQHSVKQSEHEYSANALRAGSRGS